VGVLIQLQRLDPRDASVLPMKSKNDFTGRPSEAHDVLDSPATGSGVLGGQRLSGLTRRLRFLFVFYCKGIMVKKLVNRRKLNEFVELFLKGVDSIGKRRPCHL
jgi:hypothetical protein